MSGSSEKGGTRFSDGSFSVHPTIKLTGGTAVGRQPWNPERFIQIAEETGNHHGPNSVQALLRQQFKER